MQRVKELQEQRNNPALSAREVRDALETLRDASTFGAAAAPLLQVMDGAVLVAHNAPFDLGFLADEIEIALLPLPKNPMLDTLLGLQNNPTSWLGAMKRK